MLNLLAFDYGAGSGRAMAGKFDGNTLTLEEIHRFTNTPVQLGDTLYWDFLRLFHEMKQGIRKAKAIGKIAALGIDTWGVDYGLLDKNGRLMGNPLHYRDSSTAGMIEKAQEQIPKSEIYKRTGIQFQPFNTLYQLLAAKINHPVILENASTFLFLPDLMRYFLTGEKSTEYTIASTSQMLDIHSGTWDTQLLETLGIPQHMLTDIISSGTLCGKLTQQICDDLGIDALPVVACAEHDTASAVIAVPAQGERYAYLSSGTWSLLGIESETPIVTETALKMNYTNEGGYNGRSRNIRFLKNIMGLWIYQECRREWEKEGDCPPYDELEASAAACAPFLCLIDPDDPIFYEPGNMPAKIVEFMKKTGQPIPETKAQTVRCIMESLALKYRLAVEGLEAIIGYKLPVLHIVGGGSKNEILSQFTANAIARPVTAGPKEATAIGNILAQLLALGEISDIAQGRALIRSSFDTVVYEPEDKDIWDSAYERFLSICAKNA